MLIKQLKNRLNDVLKNAHTDRQTMFLVRIVTEIVQAHVPEGLTFVKFTYGALFPSEVSN